MVVWVVILFLLGVVRLISMAPFGKDNPTLMLLGRENISKYSNPCIFGAGTLYFQKAFLTGEMINMRLIWLSGHSSRRGQDCFQDLMV